MTTLHKITEYSGKSTLTLVDQDGNEIHYAEAEVRGAREALALYRRAQELQSLHGRRTNDNLYPVTL